MKNPTLFFTIIFATLGVFQAHSEFYTITRKFSLEKKQKKAIVEVFEYQENEIEEIPADTLNQGISEKRALLKRKSYAEARKSPYYPKWNDNLPRRRKTKQIKVRQSPSRGPENLPALTIPNLIREIKRNGILYPDVVLAQAILETGWFRSSVCRNKNNLFGLTNPRTKDYYEFNHWTESVAAYYSKVQYRYKGGDYLTWLDKIGYAESKTYVASLIRLMKQLKKKSRSE